MAKGALGFFFGSTPKVPEFNPISPDKVQSETLTGNLNALPGAEKLASGYNQFSLDQLAKALDFFAPGQLGQAQSNILSQLKGEISPEDTQATIRNSVAAGFGKGFGGTFGNSLGIGRNLVARDLGLSTEKIKQQGFQNFLSLGQATKTPQLDPSSMFFTPSQRLASAVQQNEQLFNRNWLQAQMAAAPNPAGAWTAQLTMEVVKALASSAGSAAAGCWIAREVYGETNPMWILFRSWLMEDSPNWFRNAYIKFGEKIAKMIKPMPRVKTFIRKWMTARVKEKYCGY